MIVERKIAELRNSANQNTDDTYFSTDRQQEGMWRIDPADTISADNTGTVLVNTSGQRFKRIVDAAVNVQWFGASGLGIQDDYTALQNAIDAASAIYIFLQGRMLYQNRCGLNPAKPSVAKTTRSP